MQAVEAASEFSRAIWRALQLLPQIRSSYSGMAMYSMLTHQVSEINGLVFAEMFCDWGPVASVSVTQLVVTGCTLQVPDVRWYGVQCVAVLNALVGLVTFTHARMLPSTNLTSCRSSNTTTLWQERGQLQDHTYNKNLLLANIHRPSQDVFAVFGVVCVHGPATLPKWRA